mmetsp:Transcript_10482/g.64164  ORF Transcript_10482/g.64164 Transcript_10482/m.64164 type:complete len:215 (-) Transcript_10482:216-860(-)
MHAPVVSIGLCFGTCSGRAVSIHILPLPPRAPHTCTLLFTRWFIGGLGPVLVSKRLFSVVDFTPRPSRRQIRLGCTSRDTSVPRAVCFELGVLLHVFSDACFGRPSTLARRPSVRLFFAGSVHRTCFRIHPRLLPSPFDRLPISSKCIRFFFRSCNVRATCACAPPSGDEFRFGVRFCNVDVASVACAMHVQIHIHPATRRKQQKAASLRKSTY